MINQLKEKISSAFPIDIADRNKTIFIAGMGRSGTTWVAETINYSNEFRILFEPFFPAKTKQLKDYQYIQYIRPNNKKDKYFSPASSIIRGEIRNQWIDQFNKKYIYTKRLIKDIHCNLMLGWIKENFPGVPILFVIRHPLQVISSWQKLGWGIEALGERSDYEIVISQKQILKDYPIIEKAINKFNIKTNFEKFLFLWCIYHYVPLQQLMPNGMHIIFYENLLINPMKEFTKIFNFLDYNPNLKKINKIINLPSSTNFQKRNIDSSKDILSNGWKQKFIIEDQYKCFELLSYFNLSGLYDNEGYPKNPF